MVITIDGLSANGKSSLAKIISDSIKFKYFNTGAIYRCIALHIIENRLRIEEIDRIIPIISKLKIDFENDKIYLNNIDVTNRIKTEEISIYSNKWATIPAIKEVVRKIQKEFIKENNTIMEGRDIGTRIAPNADLKFYLYSEFETRVNRLFNMKKCIDINEIRKNLKEIDDVDINGGNFVKPQNAIEIDTTNYSINEVYEKMMKEINRII